MVCEHNRSSVRNLAEATCNRIFYCCNMERYMVEARYRPKADYAGYIELQLPRCCVMEMLPARRYMLTDSNKYVIAWGD
ncbi:hypothetical protein KXD40_005245 [Peronospora effusa]|nr:hypothetical protein KXD40_005245 [Peronospora effusa]